MQLGVDLSTSHVENSFIGTGLAPVEIVDDAIVDGVHIDDSLPETAVPPWSAIFLVLM